MDALKFFKERMRMCDYYDSVPDGCNDCPRNNKGCELSTCRDYDYIKEYIADVEKWSRERLLKEQKTQANADKIRSMTDEELARVMDMVCPPDTACNDGQQCIKCWIEWLKQPAEEEKE